MKSTTLQLATIDDVTDDVLLNSFGASSPSSLPFVAGEVATASAAGSLVARLTPDAVVWAAAVEDFPANAPVGVTWLSVVEGGFVLAGALGDDTLADVITGDVLLEGTDDARTPFIGTLDGDGALSNVVRIAEPSVAVWAAGDGARMFVARERAVTSLHLFFSIAVVAAGVVTLTPELGATNDGAVFPAGLTSREGSLFAGFAVLSASGAFSDVDITPLVPDALVRPRAASWVLTRTALSDEPRSLDGDATTENIGTAAVRDDVDLVAGRENTIPEGPRAPTAIATRRGCGVSPQKTLARPSPALGRANVARQRDAHLAAQHPPRKPPNERSRRGATADQ